MSLILVDAVKNADEVLNASAPRSNDMNSHTPEPKYQDSPAAPTGVVCSDLLGRLRAHIAMMAPHQKERHAGKLLIEAADRIGEETISRAKALSLIVNNVEEVQNGIGGVIGYKLNLTTEQTDCLWRTLESRPNES